MPRNHHNKHSRHRFLTKIQSRASHGVHQGKGIKKSIDEIAGKIGGKTQGKALVEVGMFLQTAGTLTGQPEIAALGVGVETTGEILVGGSVKEITSRIGGDVGAALGGPFLGQVGEKFGRKVGGAIDNEVQRQQREDDKGGNPTHNDNIKDHIQENEHTRDQEIHHNSVQLPNDLQGVGNIKQNVGATLQANPSDVANTLEEFEEEVEEFGDATSIMSFLVNNISHLEELGEAEKEDLFRTAVETGMFDNVLSAIGDTVI